MKVNKGTAPRIRFTERMDGYLSESAGANGDFRAAAARGRASACTISTDLVIEHPDLTELLADPTSPATISGQVLVPPLGEGPLNVTSGEFILLTPDPDHVETDNMVYRLELRSETGSSFRLDGFKVVHQGPAVRAWSDTTTLFAILSQYEDDGLAVRYRGVLHVSPAALGRLLASVTIENVPRWSDRERFRCEFATCFVGSLWRFYAGSLNERGRFPAPRPEPPSLPKPGGLAAEQVRWCDPNGLWHDRAVPDACSRLVRYRGGNKGPVVLAPGFAMSATSFALETNHPSLVELLIDRGFDVWLFDYRAGMELPSAWSQSTIDDIATIDWPRAVGEVRRITGSDDVQAFGHCVGSVSLLMTLLHGTTGIRSAVCAQFTVHPVTSRLNKAKAALHVGDGLAALGIGRVRPDNSWSQADLALDLALRPIPMPRAERCGLVTCRWINAIFGCTHVHGQLDEASHREIPNLFGVGNLTGLRHLVLMLQRGAAVDASGLNRYLPHVERLDLPIHFVAGTRNYIFHPQGTEKTLDWLREGLGRDRASRNFSVNYLDGYGHLDALIGRNAAVDVFPDIASHLEAHAQ